MSDILKDIDLTDNTFKKRMQEKEKVRQRRKNAYKDVKKLILVGNQKPIENLLEMPSVLSERKMVANTLIVETNHIKEDEQWLHNHIVDNLEKDSSDSVSSYKSCSITTIARDKYGSYYYVLDRFFTNINEFLPDGEYPITESIKALIKNHSKESPRYEVEIDISETFRRWSGVPRRGMEEKFKLYEEWSNKSKWFNKKEKETKMRTNVKRALRNAKKYDYFSDEYEFVLCSQNGYTKKADALFVY